MKMDELLYNIVVVVGESNRNMRDNNPRQLLPRGRRVDTKLSVTKVLSIAGGEKGRHITTCDHMACSESRL